MNYEKANNSRNSMKVTYINLFGQEITVDNKKTNPMVRSCGPGPTEFKCKHCVYFIEKALQ